MNTRAFHAARAPSDAGPGTAGTLAGMTSASRLGLLLALFLLPGGAAAQSLEVIGTRALGMGGAFVAVADDATATFWNPAGLVTGSVFSAVVETGRGQVDEAPDGARRQGGTLVALGTWPLGATFYRLTTAAARVVSDPRVPPAGTGVAALTRLDTTHVGVNVLQTLVSGLHVGATIKYVHGSAGVGSIVANPGSALDAARDLSTRGSSRVDLDAGVMADLRRVKVGLVVRNLLEPSFETADPGIELALPRQVRAGVAVLPTDRLILSADVDLTTTPDPTGDWRSLAAGIEQRVWDDRLAVRGGFRLSTIGDTRPTATAGGSVRIRSGMFVDGYAAVGIDAASTDGFGLGVRVVF